MTNYFITQSQLAKLMSYSSVENFEFVMKLVNDIMNHQDISSTDSALNSPLETKPSNSVGLNSHHTVSYTPDNGTKPEDTIHTQIKKELDKDYVVLDGTTYALDKLNKNEVCPFCKLGKDLFKNIDYKCNVHSTKNKNSSSSASKSE